MDKRVNINNHFRPDSAAHEIAERLLTGKPFTRQELAGKRGVSVTTINRVVKVLEREGGVVVRSVAPDGRQAQFQLVEWTEPERRNAFPPVAAAAKVMSTELLESDNQAVVEFTSAAMRYRGLATSTKTLPAIGITGKVTSVSLADDGSGAVTLDTRHGKVTLVGVQNVTRN